MLSLKAIIVARYCQDLRNSLVPRASNHTMRYSISMIVVSLACMAGIANAAPATQPTPKAAARAEQLKAGVKTFSLTLNYRGEQDKPYYRLMLSVQPVVRFKGNAFDVYTQITEAQAAKIIDFLATEGFLDRALNLNRNRSPAPPPEPCYTLAAQVDAEVGFEDWLGFDMNMLKRLDGLRAVLDGDAAKQMDLLLRRLSGHRRQWKTADPNAVWDGVLRAMQTGDKMALAKVTTEKGFKSITIRQGKGITADDMRSYGQGWAKWPLRFTRKTDEVAHAKMGPEVKEHGLDFLKTAEGWKLGQWMPGE